MREEWLNNESMEWVLFEYFEGNLPEKERIWVESKIEDDPQWAKASMEFSQTFLQPEPEAYPNKEALLKKNKVIGLWFGMPLLYKSAAAMIIIAGSIWLLQPKKALQQAEVAVTKSAKTEENVPAPLQSNEDTQYPTTKSFETIAAYPKLVKSVTVAMKLDSKQTINFYSEHLRHIPEYAVISNEIAPFFGPDTPTESMEPKQTFIQSLAQTWKKGQLKNPKIRLDRNVQDHNPVWVLNFKTDHYEAQAALLIKTHKN